MATLQNASVYITPADVKAALDDGNWGNEYDGLLGLIAKRASRALDSFCKVPPGYFQVTADTVRTFDGPMRNTGDNAIRQEYNILFYGLGTCGTELPIGVLAQAPTLVEVDDVGTGVYTTVNPPDYFPYPWNAIDMGQPYRELHILIYRSTRMGWPCWRKSVRVTGRFGWATTCPEDLKQLVIIQATRWFRRGQQHFADMGGTSSLGQEKFMGGMDPDIQELAFAWRRQAI